MCRDVFCREEVVLDACVGDDLDSHEVVTLRLDLYGAVVCEGCLFVSGCHSVKGAVKQCHLGERDGDVGGLGGEVEDERTIVVCFERGGGVMIYVELLLKVSDKFGVVGGLYELCGGSAVLAFLIVEVVGVAALDVSMVLSDDA